jgi:hypothetical protein
MAHHNDREHEHVVTVADETLSVGGKAIAFAAGGAGLGAILGPAGAMVGAFAGGTIGVASGLRAAHNHKP